MILTDAQRKKEGAEGGLKRKRGERRWEKKRMTNMKGKKTYIIW